LEREKLLEGLIDRVPIRLHSPGAGVSHVADLTTTSLRQLLYLCMRASQSIGVPQTWLRRLPYVGRAATWDSWPLRQINPTLERHLQPAVFGIDMYRMLRDSAVSLNTHIDVTGPEAANCRLFEATGAGSCLLTDWKPNLDELFRID